VDSSEELEKDWIDANFSYLVHRFGSRPIFEPSAFFYENFGKLGCASEPGVGFDDELKRIYTWLGIDWIPIRYESGLKNPGEFRYSVMKQSQNPFVVPNSIVVSDRYRSIDDGRKRGMVIGAIISHEIAHFCLMRGGIMRETTDNERLTDLAIIALGLGKLYFNGQGLIIGNHSQRFGYLLPENMVYAFMEYQKIYKISSDSLYKNISSEAQSHLLGYQTRIIRDLDKSGRQERMERSNTKRLSLYAEYRDFYARQERAHSDLQNIRSSLSFAIKDQNTINQTLQLWEISNEDHRVLGEFVIALYSAAYELDLVRITEALHILERDALLLERELEFKTPEEKEWEKERQRLKELNAALAVLNDRIASLFKKISAVQSAHERCFSQITVIRNVREHITAIVQECADMVKEIKSFHQFLIHNPKVWYRYVNNPGIVEKTMRLADDEVHLSSALKETEQVTALVSVQREEYPRTLKNIFTIRDLVDKVLSRCDDVAKIRQRLVDQRDSLRAITREYLEHAQISCDRLKAMIADSALNQKDLTELKIRQDRIYQYYPTARFPVEDEQVFEEINNGIYSSDLNSELARHIHTFTDTFTAIERNAVRVRLLSESEEIIPIEFYWKEFYDAAEGIRIINSRIIRWRTTQQKYLDKIDTCALWVMR
jgi:hypothetical protein